MANNYVSRGDLGADDAEDNNGKRFIHDLAKEVKRTLAERAENASDEAGFAKQIDGGQGPEQADAAFFMKPLVPKAY